MMTQLPHITEKPIVSFLKFYSFIFAFPLQWNWEAGKIVEWLKPGIKLYTYYGVALKIWIYWPFLVITLWLNFDVYLAQHRLVHLIVHCTWASIYGMCVPVAYTFCRKGKELVYCVNETVAINKWVHEFFGNELFERAANIRNIILILQCFYAVFELSLSPVFFLTFYDQDWYLLYYILPPQLKHYCVELKWPLAIVSLLTTWIEATQWGATLAGSYCNLVYLQSVTTIMKLMGNFLRTNHRNRKAFVKIMGIYSKLRILNTLFNQALCKIAWPFCIALASVLFIGGFCTVVIRNSTGSPIVKVIGGFFMILSLSVLLAAVILFAQVHTASFKLYETILRHRPVGKWSRILCSSYQCFGVDYGIFFVVKKQTLFTLLSELSTAAISAVLYIN